MYIMKSFIYHKVIHCPWLLVKSCNKSRALHNTYKTFSGY